MCDGRRFQVDGAATNLNRILTDFNNFCNAEPKIIYKTGHMHFLIYYLKKVLLMT